LCGAPAQAAVDRYATLDVAAGEHERALLILPSQLAAIRPAPRHFRHAAAFVATSAMPFHFDSAIRQS